MCPDSIFLMLTKNGLYRASLYARTLVFSTYLRLPYRLKKTRLKVTKIFASD